MTGLTANKPIGITIGKKVKQTGYESPRKEVKEPYGPMW